MEVYQSNVSGNNFNVNNPVVTDGLVSWWKMNEGSGSTLTDSVSAINATLYGGAWGIPTTSIPPLVPVSTGVQNIMLNGYNLQSSTVITSKFDHEGIGIDQCKLKLPHRAGEKFIAYTYASRKITLEGHIVNQTSSDQDNNIDLLKQSTLGAMAVPLTFDYAGGSLNRKYNVNVVNVILPRDYYTLTYIPFSIEVEAVDPPYAQDLACF